MKVSMALTCDYAAVDPRGKLNIIGAWSRLTSHQFPMRHDLCFLVLKFDIGRGEWGTQREIVVKLIDQDGKQMLRIGPIRMVIPDDQPDSDATETPLLVKIDHLEIPSEGTYHWSILVDHDEKHSFPLVVKGIPTLLA
jgi:hypothetical protein